MQVNLKMGKVLTWVFLPCLVVGVLPAFAQEVIVQRSVETTVQSQPVAVAKASITYIMAFPNFSARIHDLSAWVDMGFSRGWLTSAQASDYKAQAESLLAKAATTRVSAIAVDKGNVDFLDKELTRLNASISRAMNDNQVASTGSVLK